MACMLGAMLTKDEVDEFMREADVVRQNLDFLKLIFSMCLFINTFY